MNVRKLTEQVEACREILSQIGVDKERYPDERFLDSAEHEFSHCYALLDQIVFLVEEEKNINVAIQLLGFVQGCLWSHKLILFADIAVSKEICTTA